MQSLLGHIAPRHRRMQTGICGRENKSALYRGPKDHINIRILQSGSKAQYKGIPETMLCSLPHPCVCVVVWSLANRGRRRIGSYIQVTSTIWVGPLQSKAIAVEGTVLHVQVFWCSFPDLPTPPKLGMFLKPHTGVNPDLSKTFLNQEVLEDLGSQVHG